MTPAATTVEPGSVRGLRRVEYDALVATGLLDGEPVELLQGALVRMSPHGPAHAEAIRRLTMALARQAPLGWTVDVQLPLAVADDSQPEPDLALLRTADWSHDHPPTALLVVEVSRSSLRTDLGVKAVLYAAAGVTDYWVVDVVARVVHVHRNPTLTGYAVVDQVRDGELRTSEAVDVRIDVTSLFA